MLEIKNITVRFGGLVAVNDVSFSVGSHEILGLIGPNGAGKTTLFNAVSGLVRPTLGHVIMDKSDITRLALYKRARLGLGRTFQIPKPMHHLTVRENLIVAQTFGARENNPERIDEILELLEIKHKADSDAASELAMQELKRLEIAKALATRPKLLLLDEVLAGLESQAKRLFMEKLKQINSTLGIGIIIVEHDIETISKLCSRVIALNFGQLIADGTPREVFTNPKVIESYTGASHVED
ncbi:ABC transporter ATP-binding protein [Bartonella choladocola]|uniref:Amino acid/amide ABC transporter ATP-binding protein 1, HAAT family n=1 Tax=Bartonella choladocola TaxID=2750995 RepID=A0A1U9MG29_9HYPH|nr:ABC transporter ATP-binding protein [Bartonella choladocola]AQT46591.1 amino acid/amide ABC transporter ATP-binding protein 1, HAAT family [Bartonella choladocola]